MRVLVADDEPVTRRALVGLLEHLGHESVEACDGQEAWTAMHKHDAPALIILDWMMPAISGPEICRRVRASAKRPYQYILMLTARESVVDVVEGMEAGADDYLRKPFDLRELRVRVRAGERMLALQDELRARATTDELTGVLNRRGIVERVEHELALIARNERALCVVLFDIDNFKAINDTHGHAVGDDVLKEVASRIHRQLRAYDDVARYGGEEFLAVLPSCELPAACRVAERVRRAISAEPVHTSSGPIGVSVSAGVAGTGEHQFTERSSLIARADDALYAAKAKGRNRVESA